MAADLLGSMRVEIVGDNSKLDKSIDTSKKKTEDYGKSSAKLSKSLTTLFSGIAFAAVAKKIFDVSKRAAALAASGEEIRSKFNAVFKDGAQDVQEWAEEYATSVGRSDTQTLKFLATLQDTFVPMGIARDTAAEFSKTMVELAGDVGSFNDVSQEDVIRDFQSALVGNSETVRKYGIVINEAGILQEALNSGLIENKDQLTEQVKIQARMNLILAGTTDAQGDLLRTQESTTNVNAALNSQIEKLLESYGAAVNEGILPFKKNLLDEITTVNQSIKAHFLRNKVLEGQATLIEKLTLKEIEQARAEEELQQAKDNLAASEASIAKNLASSSVQLQNAAKATQASLEGQRRLIETRQNAVDGIERQAEALERAIIEERTLLDEKIALTQETEDNTEATDENTESIDDNTESVKESVIAWGGARDIIRDTNSELPQAVLDMIAYKEAMDDAAISADDLAQIGMASLTSGFEQLGQSIVENGLQFKDFGKLALNSLAEVLSALGAQLAAQAALHFFGLFPNIPAGTGALAGSTAAFTAAGVVRGIAGSFQDGGIVPGTPSRIDNTVASVASGELIANQDQKDRMLMEFLNGKSSGGGTTRIIVNIDKKPIIDTVAKASKNGTMIIDSRSVK